uniref:Ornithine carbamoyltransferase n=1 Tax=uncultured SAR11 cluster bacterium HF0770_37D02 TaxID=710726 RepID=E0XYV8_9PROT|nr:ornithine carbamoyltransferase [uncultured SAR11 cluster bacterium HF0770_37D02]
MRNFINLSDIDKQELRKIIDHAKSQKQKGSTIKTDVPLAGKTLIMIFEKPSTRTRLSFELAMKKLGGDVLVLNPKESHYGSGDESIHDTAKILSQYGDVVMMRTNKHEHFLEFSKHLEIPIINGLTNLSHPVQIMATVLSYEELRGSIANKKIAWLGDGNNVVYSLIEAAVQFDFQLAIACPKKLEPNKKIIKWAKDKKANILITKNPKEAAKDASAVITDKWISMGDSVNKKKKKKLLKPYQVNEKIMKLAKSDAIFMHCLPAKRNEEVTDSVMDGEQSAVWLEALNRMHVQKSIIQFCLNLL